MATDTMIANRVQRGGLLLLLALSLLGSLPLLGSSATHPFGYAPDRGALDLNVQPDQAEIFIDGELVGVADQYDGFPRYLWLPAGDRRLVIHLPGYRPVVREYTLVPGEVIDIDLRLERGESPPLEEILYRRKRDDVATTPELAVEERPTPSTAADDSWRRRRPQVAENASASLLLEVTPKDAAVYLDDRLLGSGEDLGRLHAALIVAPGTHRLVVVRPGYKKHEATLSLGAAEETTLRVELLPDRP